MASLQERAREAADALREMGRHGIVPAHMARDPVVRELLRHVPDEATPQWFAWIRELLDELENTMRRLPPLRPEPPV
ncbi:MAG: hypothetical protein Fur0039_03630 [Rhodocyclaceae bacterium]